MKKNIMIFFLFVFASLGFSQQSSYIHLNKMVAKLVSGKLVAGIWISGLHPSNAVGLVDMNGYPTYEESMNQPMVDFILIDMEHQPYDISDLRNFLLALNSRREVMRKGNLQPNIAALVRLPSDGAEPVHTLIKQALDVGVHGIVVPHVRTAAEAEKIVKACRYVQPVDSKIKEPAGTRGASPWLSSYLWGLTLDEYVARADLWPLNPDGDLMAVIMIEDEEGVENIDEILQVKGIGAVIFGPYDFSFSIGHPGEVNHPTVLENWNFVKRACDRADVPLIGFANPDDIQQKLTENYKILLFGHEVRNNGVIPKVLEEIKKAGY
jgi:4-hydroxy-2-oxoheptanedioate aldolase